MSELLDRQDLWVPSGAFPFSTAWIPSGAVVIGHVDVDLGAVVVRVSSPVASRVEWIGTAKAMHADPDGWQRAAVPLEAVTHIGSIGPEGVTIRGGVTLTVWLSASDARLGNRVAGGVQAANGPSLTASDPSLAAAPTSVATTARRTASRAAAIEPGDPSRDMRASRTSTGTRNVRTRPDANPVRRSVAGDPA